MREMRVLVVEDTLLVAEVIRDQLESCGFTVVGPASRLHKALALAREESLDGAILDIDLAGELSFPIAEELSRRQIPFIFVTGYDDIASLPAHLRTQPRLRKPFQYQQLIELLATHFTKPAEA